MKKLLLSMGAFVLCSTFSGLSQQTKQINFNAQPVLKQINVDAVISPNAPRALTCIDTISYPYAKEAMLGTSTWATFGIWQSDAESFSQTFHASSSLALTINGVEFVGKNNNEDGVASSTVRARIFAVDASNNPIGAALATGSLTVTNSTAPGFYYINFSTPITVTANYAIVLDVTNANSVFDVWVNNPQAGQSYDEGLARFKSNWSGYGTGGNWTPIPSVTGIGGSYDFEPLVAPLVSYAINTTATVTPVSACVGQPVLLNNTTSNFYVSSRMYNANVFRTHFSAAPDSTFVWAPTGDINALVWQKNPSYTYTTPGTYNAATYTLSGLLNSCVDNKITPIVINPVDDATFNYASSTLCVGGTNVSPSTIASPGGTFSSTAGLSINASTGEINLSTSVAGTYVVTYTTNGTCSSTSTKTITITNAPNASFSYPSTSFCANASNPVPNLVGSAGVFSSSTGLSINASTGEVNLAASTPGTYTVTNTINTSGCPIATDQATITINAVDNASFAYASTTLCTGSGTVLPTGIVTPGGTFTAPSDLSINTSTGEINTNTSIAGTYTITYTTTGVCPSSSTQTVTIATASDATFNYSSSSFCANSGNESPAGVATPGGTYSSTTGLSINPSTGAINTATSTPGTYVVTYTISGACASSSTQNVTINAAPDATVSVAGVTITAQTSGATYQWKDCGSNTDIAGATNQSFTPTVNGSYAVVVTANGCSSTSACTTINSLGIGAIDQAVVSVYPNPTENMVIVDGLTGTSTIKVTDANGKTITKEMTNAASLTMNMETFSQGVYMFHVSTDNGSSVVKVIKK